MNKKINNLKEIEYMTAFNLVGEHIIKGHNSKPKSEALNSMYESWRDVGFYVHNLMDNERHYNQSMEEYRSDKLRAVIRARVAEEKIIELEAKINQLQTKLDVGL